MAAIKVFREEELAFFEKISWDKNPLHRNDEYARRTQFGQKVVYGIYATLFGIGYWLNGRQVRFSNIKADFKKPLFLGEEYDLACSETPKKVDITFSKFGQVRLKIRITNYDIPLKPLPQETPRCGFKPKDKAENFVGFSKDNVISLRNFVYADGWDYNTAKPKDFKLDKSQLPNFQLQTLLWSTYLVGMEIPGQQALYSSFEFEFENNVSEASEFSIDLIDGIFDPRFNQITLSGNSKIGLRSFQIIAFLRPEQINYSMEAIKTKIKKTTDLNGKTSFITGASRGFGSVLTRALALAGSNVVLNFNKSAQDAKKIQKEVLSIGTSSFLLQGDITSQSDWLKMTSSLKDKALTIDILVLNAFPNIPMVPFSNQDPKEFMAFTTQSLNMVYESTRHLLPMLKAGGKVIYISTIYTVEPLPGFSHYITAKSAAEGLMHSLATEFRNLNFIIFRPSKMLTDQTNSIMAQEEMASPIEVANYLISKIDDAYTPGKVSTIDFK